jgi:hypothetical protein
VELAATRRLHQLGAGRTLNLNGESEWRAGFDVRNGWQEH